MHTKNKKLKPFIPFSNLQNHYYEVRASFTDGESINTQRANLGLLTQKTYRLMRIQPNEKLAFFTERMKIKADSDGRLICKKIELTGPKNPLTLWNFPIVILPTEVPSYSIAAVGTPYTINSATSVISRYLRGELAGAEERFLCEHLETLH